MVEAEKSGASVVLALLRASVASKSIRVIELFNALDTSKDGLISRWEDGERPLFRRRGGAALFRIGHAARTRSLCNRFD